MTAITGITAQIGTTDWDLVEMHSDGDHCFHCGNVRMHVIVVRNVVDGRERVICPACCLAVTGAALDRHEAARLLDEAQETGAEEIAAASAESLFIVELDGPTFSAQEYREYRAELEAERGIERWLEDRGFWAARAQEFYETTHGVC